MKTRAWLICLGIGTLLVFLVDGCGRDSSSDQDTQQAHISSANSK